MVKYKKYINLALFAILVCSLALHLPAFFLAHIENDEVIYQTLADKLSKNLTDYSLQDTYVIKQLPESYNKPLFYFHPPLFCMLLALIKIILGVRFEIFIPILFSLMTVLFVFFIARELYDEKVALLSAAINACCPVFLHASTKIWMDSQLTFFVTGCIYVALIAARTGMLRYYILLAIVIAGAIMTKLAALIIAPLVFFILLYKNKARKIYILYTLALVIILIFPWFYWFYKTFGTVNIWWLKPDYKLLEMFPFTRMAKERPPYFYITNLIFVAPVYIFSLISIIRGLPQRRRIVESLWVACFVGIFTFSGWIMDCGYVTRYVLPCVPALAILAAGIIAEKNSAILYAASIVFLGYEIIIGILNSYIFQVADIFPLGYFLKM